MVIAMSTSMIVKPDLFSIMVLPLHQRAWPRGDMANVSDADALPNFINVHPAPIPKPDGMNITESPANDI
jgi:hypothetical protein